MSRAHLIHDQLLLEGEALVREGRFAEGEQRARAVLAQQPRSAGAHHVLGVSALAQDRHAEALEHLERALRLDRVNARYHHAAALCLAPLGRVEEAIAADRRALRFQPRFVEARANLADLLEHAGRLDEAAEIHRRCLALDPGDWAALTRLGFCERLLGRADQALETLGRALALQPRCAAALNEMALALLALGRRAEAIARLREAVAAEPRFGTGWGNLCKLLYVEHLEAVQAAQASGSPPPDAAPVVACLDRLLELDPEHVEFRYLRDSLAGVRIERPPDAYVAGFFDRFAPRFEQRVLGELRYAAPEIAARCLEPWLASRRDLRVADLGCGTGLSGAFVRPHAARLVGVDLSGGMLEQARARGLYDELVREEIGDWLARQPPASLDLLVALDVLIYVGALDRVMNRAASALAAGGRFVFTTEDLDGGDDFALGRAGRYAHCAAYVTGAAAGAGLGVAQSQGFEIRHEAGLPVRATLFAMEKPCA